MVLNEWLYVSPTLLFLLHSCVFSFTLGWSFLWLCVCVWLHPILGLSVSNLFTLSFFVAVVLFCMSWHYSYMRPTRHYTVFLCEDSSGDELSQDDDSIAAFPEHFLLSAPFEWSLFKCFSSLILLMIIKWIFDYLFTYCARNKFLDTRNV